MGLSVKRKLIHSLIFNKRINRALVTILIFFKPFFTKSISKFPVMQKIELITADKTRFFLDNYDGKDAIASMLFWRGLEGFEKNEIKIFQILLNSNEVIIDIGANTGIYTIIAGVKNKHVYAFEPVPYIFERLCDNIKINNLTKITPINQAVSDRDGSISLFIGPECLFFSTSSSTLKNFRDYRDEIIVDSVKLDTFILSNGISHVDLIKIDTEATEDKVLTGSRKVVIRDQPLILCEVLHNRCEEKLNSFFENLPYRYFMISDEGLIPKDNIEGDNKNPNYLLIPESKLDLIKNLDKIE